ncbi:hypothetical protein TeGR_g6280 [Tetraparma gracilis]|uniref:Uncharacterized protein n=1 Tax=Tetraparma gracilis TaxID=2962635 RepID=A0ABQ6N6Z3_9STRA|nr:hypothetical protein TeGR_g6280 [Tetraparma gracilis]
MALPASRAVGPLSSLAVQYGLLGFAALSLAPEQMKQSALQFLQALVATLALSPPSSPSQGYPQPTFILQPPAAAAAAPSALLLSSLPGYLLPAAACWGAYAFAASLLPSYVTDILPVTRKFFATSVSSLARGLISVRDALAGQIEGLSGQVDEVSGKQDATNASLAEARGELDELNRSVSEIAESLSRCEGQLGRAAERQSYTARGVRLLHIH